MKKISDYAPNERLEALRILLAVIQQKTPLTALLHSSSVSSFSKNLCFGVCRYYYRLVAIAEALMEKRPKSMDIWISLLMGLYQLHVLHLADYAAVTETVALMDKIKKPWAKRLINAVLRRYCREKTLLLLSLKTHPFFQYNHPHWFLNHIQHAWPNDWTTILSANDAHPPMSLRVNRQQQSRNAYLHQLNISGFPAVTHTYAAEGLCLNTACDVHVLPGFKEGAFSVQDEAAQLAIPLLDLKPQLHFLDACTAPGGKLCHALESEQALASATGIDIDASRLKRVTENLNRLKLHATLIEGDALKPKHWWDGRCFDRILLDAPCSATGVIRRHPDIKLLREEKDIHTIITLQQRLLETLWPLLAPNGRLVYATCSILPEENEMQIAAFVARHSDCHPFIQPQPWGRPTGHGWQILPGEQQMDGFFYSVLLKQAPPPFQQRKA